MREAVQTFENTNDAHTSDWDSVEEKKRHAIDEALRGSTEDLARGVREALLTFEHTKLARRFQAFVQANVAPEYFNASFETNSYPVGRSDLPEALAAAYRARSAYVHQIRRLPDMVTFGGEHREMNLVDRQMMLTLQGLSRLVRHVIMTFVRRQPTVEKEVYNYSRERAGVAQVRMAPSFWIAHVDGDISGAGRDKLEGFLEELASAMAGLPGATVTDISEVLKHFLVLAPSMKVDKRRPYLALLCMFNAIAKDRSVPRSPSVEDMIQKELGAQCPEALVALAYFGEVPEWSLEDHSRAFEEYKRRRGSKSGIRFPRLFEAAIALELAERYRSAGRLARAKEIISEAADDCPGHTELRQLGKEFLEDAPINWKEVLLSVGESAENCQQAPAA